MMKLFRTKLAFSVLTAALAIVYWGASHAQSFPNKPIRMVVAYPPGGAADILARAINPKAGEMLGQQIIIENQGGAGGKIAAQTVARATPDGYTILLTAIGSHTLSLFEKDTGYHAIKDFSPITQATESVLCIAANVATGPKSMVELVDFAKKFPGKLAYGTTGSETMLAMEQVALLANTKMLFIPYKGGAQATTDLIAGTIPLVLQPVITFLSHVKSGKVRILAVMLPKRWDDMPDVPTIQEIVPGFEKGPGGLGIWGPAGMPSAIATRLQVALASGLRHPEIAEKMKAQGLIPIGNSPAEFAKEIDSGVAINARLVKASGVEIR
ncbi:MAG: Bug family tripartite tricarboxylate transporter substrate binding protein [Burkholderiales bacterium]